MVVCESCGSENPDDVHFCVMCGAFIPKPAAPPPPAPPVDRVPPPEESGPSVDERPPEPLAPPPVVDPEPASGSERLLPPIAPVESSLDAASPPPWFRRTGVAVPAAPAATELPTLDELVDAPPDGTGGGNGPPGLTARPPQRVQPARQAPASSTRPQQALAIVLDQSVVEVQPGATASFRVTVRNTGALVEGCTVSVRGIPAAWTRMEPDRFNLDVDQQRDVLVHITPPRVPKTTAGRTALAIVVRSEVNEEIQQRCDATLVIEPFFDLTTTLDPVEIEGKRGGYTYVNVENQGNKSERVTFTGTEAGKRLRFGFRPAELEVRPGQRGSVGVDVRARRRVWSGVEKSRQFSVAVTGAEGPPPPPMQGRFAQRASWPRWVLPVVAAILAIAIPTTLLLVNRSLDKSEASALVGVPNLNGLTADAAKQSLQQKQLVPNLVNVYRPGDPGVVVDQNPAPGQKVQKNTPIKVGVSTDRTVPDVQNKPWKVAQDAIAREGMTMALEAYQDGPPDKEGLIAWQDPNPDKPSPDGVVKVGVYRTAELKLLDYRGADQISVQTALKNAGILVEAVEEGSDQLKGTILGQAPDPGTVMKKGQNVTLIVSSGHPPDATTTTVDPTAASDASPPST